MNKFIVDNRTELHDFKIFSMILQVIESGKISNDGKQYPYLTVFHNPENAKEYHIVSSLNKKSERFVIYEAKKDEKS